VHGGVRYLARGDLGLVREALRERAIMRANAPNLVSNLGFLCPAYRWYESPYYFAGLTAYDAFAGASGFGRSRYLSAPAALRRAPGLRAPGLRGAIRYHDGQFDDARYAVALMRTAVRLGAVVVNYARAAGFEQRDGRIAGVRVVDGESGDACCVRARAVVNATGTFSDSVRRLDEPSAEPMLSLSRGSHIVVPRDVFPGDDALLVPKTDDGRVLFIIPWLGRVLIGTTDLPESSPSVDPVASASEIAYLVEHASRYLERRLDAADIVASFCGLRPLVKRRPAATARLSREHVVEVARSGLVSIAGGKWTTYRKMAQDAIDAAARVAGLSAAPCTTARLRLDDDPAAERAALIAQDASLSTPLCEGLPYSRADAAAAFRYEMARTADDVLSRRTRIAFLDADGAAACAPAVEQLAKRYKSRYA
jgi:glycerol-3-phosphate dehydrogenase